MAAKQLAHGFSKLRFLLLEMFPSIYALDTQGIKILEAGGTSSESSIVWPG